MASTAATVTGPQKIIVALGYVNVYWFRGGMQEWLEKGMPVVEAYK